ncbi:FG-GAP repeat domain-containing protein, partial [Salmonella sp. s54395]|uniref:FG-GAP repeat domain-containing protein n=1 Tax=Salmonella sp. s54395 TaxID=3159664 RepID=UPI00397F8108
IAYANAAGNFHDRTGWEEGIEWCSHSGASLFIADFNGDGKDDMLCHDSAGHKWVALANCQSNFSDGTSWEAGLAWCYHSTAVLHVGDYNGDKKADMLCHDTGHLYP